MDFSLNLRNPALSAYGRPYQDRACRLGDGHGGTMSLLLESLSRLPTASAGRRCDDKARNALHEAKTSLKDARTESFAFLGYSPHHLPQGWPNVLGREILVRSNN
jgi:hypothetical protein